MSNTRTTYPIDDDDDADDNDVCGAGKCSKPHTKTVSWSVCVWSNTP